MKKIWFFITVAIIAIGLSNDVKAQTQATKFTVTGLVIDADSLYSIPAVNVFLLDANKNILIRTVTNQKGYFNFANIPSGSYRLRTIMPGYKVTIFKVIEVSEQTRKNIYKMKIKKLEKGDVDIDLDYLDYLDWPEDRDIFIDEK